MLRALAALSLLSIVVGSGLEIGISDFLQELQPLSRAIVNDVIVSFIIKDLCAITASYELNLISCQSNTSITYLRSRKVQNLVYSYLIINSSFTSCNFVLPHLGLQCLLFG